jgi:hypothetical protein
MYQLSTLAVSTNHYFRLRTLRLCLADELRHQFAAVGIAACQEALNAGWVVYALDHKVVCAHDVRECGKEGRPRERSHVSLFCCLLRGGLVSSR